MCVCGADANHGNRWETVQLPPTMPPLSIHSYIPSPPPSPIPVLPLLKAPKVKIPPTRPPHNIHSSIPSLPSSPSFSSSPSIYLGIRFGLFSSSQHILIFHLRHHLPFLLLFFSRCQRCQPPCMPPVSINSSYIPPHSPLLSYQHFTKPHIFLLIFAKKRPWSKHSKAKWMCPIWKLQ